MHHFIFDAAQIMGWPSADKKCTGAGQAYALYTTTVTTKNDNIFIDSTFRPYFVVLWNLMITHYKVPNFTQFSHRKYISDTKTLTDHKSKEFIFDCKSAVFAPIDIHLLRL